LVFADDHVLFLRGRLFSLEKFKCIVPPLDLKGWRWKFNMGTSSFKPFWWGVHSLVQNPGYTPKELAK